MNERTRASMTATGSQGLAAGVARARPVGVGLRRIAPGDHGAAPLGYLGEWRTASGKCCTRRRPFCSRGWPSISRFGRAFSTLEPKANLRWRALPWRRSGRACRRQCPPGLRFRWRASRLSAAAPRGRWYACGASSTLRCPRGHLHHHDEPRRRFRHGRPCARARAGHARLGANARRRCWRALASSRNHGTLRSARERGQLGPSVGDRRRWARGSVARPLARRSGDRPGRPEPHRVRRRAHPRGASHGYGPHSLWHGIAGLAALAPVLGYKGYYESGLGSGAGFGGIAVALLGRGHPLGLVLAALLFGTLEQGGLVVNARVPMEMTTVLQAVVIVAVALADARVRGALWRTRAA